MSLLNILLHQYLHIWEDLFFRVIFSVFFLTKTRQPLTRITLSTNKRYSIEKPKKSVAAGEMSTDEFAEDQETEKEGIRWN